MTQPPEDHGQEPTPPLQPFAAPGQPPPPPSGAAPGQPSPPSGAAPGQPFGTAPGQPYGTPQPGYGQPYPTYQPYPGGSSGTIAPGRKDPALAEWWQRLLARIVDGIVLAVIILPLWIPALITALNRVQQVADRYPDLNLPGAQQAFRNSLNHTIAGMIGTFVLLGLGTAVITFGYDWLQHGLWGQTLGKRALGTKVVTADTRSRISGRAACGRAAVYALAPGVPYVGSMFGLLDDLWLTWDPRRQCLHDKAARTVVVKLSALAPPAPPSSA